MLEFFEFFPQAHYKFLMKRAPKKLKILMKIEKFLIRPPMGFLMKMLMALWGGLLERVLSQIFTDFLAGNSGLSQISMKLGVWRAGGEWW